MSTQDVVIARAALKLAEAREAEERKAKLIEQLSVVRQDLRAALNRFQALATLVTALRTKRDQLRTRLKAANDAIAASWGMRPGAADYLPDDPNVAVWRREHSALEMEQKRLLAALQEVNPEAHMQEIVELNDPAQGLIVRLQYSERNILEALDGYKERTKWQRGEITVVR